MYSEYKAHVLGVQSTCTESTKAMYCRKDMLLPVEGLSFSLHD